MVPTSATAVQRALQVQPYTTSPVLAPQTKNLAVRQAISDITSLSGANPSITSVNPNKVINFMPLPETVTVTILNTTDGELDVNIFNNDTYVAVPGGVTVTYSDGFAGKLINKLINGLQNAQGLLVYGFNVTGYDNGGVKSDAVLNASSLEARYYNGNGSSYIPAQISVAGAERNTQFKDGLLTVKTLVIFNFVAQFKMHLGAGEKLQFVLNLVPIQD